MTELRALLCEDSEDDAQLILRELSRGGFQVLTERVEAAHELGHLLGTRSWDIVISDYTMPGFTALDALDIVQRSSQPELPFLIVSGGIGEESVVAALKAGASNYLLKSNLAELVPMVQRELKDARIRRERNEAFAALEQAVTARDEFLSIASHELKTPLTTLRLQVQNVLRAARVQTRPILSNAQIVERLEIVERSAERLGLLIERLLDITRVTAGRLRLSRERLDLVTITRGIINGLTDVLRDARSEITLLAPDSIIGTWDRERLDAIVMNLLANAVKYGARKPIRVELDQDRDRAYLRVIDHGIGVRPDDQQRIFGRFERAVPERHYGGFGVGLWLVQQFVHAHGGTIEVHSVPGQGATFSVTLPKQGIP